MPNGYTLSLPHDWKLAPLDQQELFSLSSSYTDENPEMALMTDQLQYLDEKMIRRFAISTNSTLTIMATGNVFVALDPMNSGHSAESIINAYIDFFPQTIPGIYIFDSSKDDTACGIEIYFIELTLDSPTATGGRMLLVV